VARERIQSDNFKKWGEGWKGAIALADRAKKLNALPQDESSLEGRIPTSAVTMGEIDALVSLGTGAD